MSIVYIVYNRFEELTSIYNTLQGCLFDLFLGVLYVHLSSTRNVLKVYKKIVRPQLLVCHYCCHISQYNYQPVSQSVSPISSTILLSSRLLPFTLYYHFPFCSSRYLHSSYVPVPNMIPFLLPIPPRQLRSSPLIPVSSPSQFPLYSPSPETSFLPHPSVPL